MIQKIQKKLELDDQSSLKMHVTIIVTSNSYKLHDSK